MARRIYDSKRWLRLRRKLVTAVKLNIYPSPSPPYTRWFSIQMQRRGEHKALHNEGYCEQEGSVTKCYIEHDGGGVRVIPRSISTVLMRLGIQPPFGPNGEVIKQDERIVLVPRGTKDIDDGTGTEVTGGKDDHEFLLKRVDDAVCVGIDQAGAAISKDILPLKRGFYVEAKTQCEQASNATLDLFLGHVFRFNCELKSLQRQNGSYKIVEQCSVRGSRETVSGIYRIISDTEYAVRYSNGTSSHFKYCSQNTLPEPWRSNEIDGH
jgi:hypothetical protein